MKDVVASNERDGASLGDERDVISLRESDKPYNAIKLCDLPHPSCRTVASSYHLEEVVNLSLGVDHLILGDAKLTRRCGAVDFEDSEPCSCGSIGADNVESLS